MANNPQHTNTQKFCGKCGAKLTVDSHFCWNCGSPIITKPSSEDDASNSSIISGNQSEASQLGIENQVSGAPVVEVNSCVQKVKQNTSTPQQVEAPGNGQPVPEQNGTSSFAQPQEQGSISNFVQTQVPPGQEIPATKAKTSTFKAAMDTSKRKSKGKIPMIVLVTLITMLSASVALAAYYVYVEVIVPQTQERTETADEIPAQEPVQEENEQEIEVWVVKSKTCKSVGDEYNADSISEFTYNYDKYNKLTSIEEKPHKFLRENSIKLTYDGEGKIISQSSYWQIEGNTGWGSIPSTYNYSCKYDSNGLPKTIEGKYDTNRGEDNDSYPTTTTWSISYKNNVPSSIKNSAIGNQTSYSSDWSITTNSQGRIVQLKNTSSGTSEVLKLVYNDKSQVIQANSSNNTSIKFKYDSAGNLTTVSYLDVEGQIYMEDTYSYELRKVGKEFFTPSSFTNPNAVCELIDGTAGEMFSINYVPLEERERIMAGAKED